MRSLPIATTTTKNKKPQTITTTMTTLGERRLLGHSSAFAVSLLKLELYFSLLFSLRFNFPKEWIDPSYFFLTVSSESHCIGQAELLHSC